MEDEKKAQEPSWPLIGMTAREAAQALRVDVKTVQEAIRDGGLPARLVGKGWRISPQALEAWIASGTGEGRRTRGAVAEGSLVPGGDPNNRADFRNESEDGAE